MKMTVLLISVAVFLITGINGFCQDTPVSPATEECLDCHATIHPGIVGAWKSSLHAKATPEQAMTASALSRKVSSPSVPEGMETVVVGCAECHTFRPDAHADTVHHNGYRIHVVVSPQDCAVCHLKEADQYKKNIMSFAEKNLAENVLYQDLLRQVIGYSIPENGKIRFEPADASTRAEACFYCHGTRLTVQGFETRDSDYGEMTFARIDRWPNQGVGRVNPDGSRGACTACHTRHAFSIEMARKPDTCMQCHIGPDVPAYKVYMASKHGNIFSAMNASWDFGAVPWRVGKHFTAPTCAVCHMSLLIDSEGTVVAERTHQIGNRLPTRLFGLIYAHAQPKHPDTTIIRNKSALPLPTDLDGTPASDFLINPAEQAVRTQNMQSVCLSCHSRKWVKGHWKRYEDSIRETNAATLSATGLLKEIWRYGYAQNSDSLFDEAVEKKWMDIWLFHGNTVRFAAAMAGGGDYGVYANGRYQLNQKISEISEWYLLRKRIDAK